MMTIHWKGLLVVAGVLAICWGLTVVLYLVWAKRSKKGRSPVGKDHGLLRRAGESLEIREAQLVEKAMDELANALAVPPLILLLPVFLVPVVGQWAEPRSWILWGVGASAVGMLVSTVHRVRRMIGILKERRACFQGARGERYVADWLDQLREEKMYAFHDVPAQGAKSAFNLDHVVVGASGVFVVETKTYTKDRKDADGADHVVVFDGQRLTWPGGFVDDKPLAQVRANAEWLAKELKRRLGVKLPIQPIVTLPGWYVDRKGAGDVWVMNPKQLGTNLGGKAVLDEKTVDQVRRQLDDMCRTVMFDG